MCLRPHNTNDCNHNQTQTVLPARVLAFAVLVQVHTGHLNFGRCWRPRGCGLVSVDVLTATMSRPHAVLMQTFVQATREIRGHRRKRVGDKQGVSSMKQSNQQALQSSMKPSSQQSIAEQSIKPEQERASLECKAINQSSQHYNQVMSLRNL